MNKKATANTEELLKRGLQRLKAKGLKHTKSRELMLRHLVSFHGPFSVKEIYQELKQFGLDFTTGYRILTSFEKIGLARRCDFGDGIARYEFSDGQGHHHHHVICVKCRKVEPISHCRLSRLEREVRDLGYSKVRHVLEFMGICPICTSKSA